MPWRARSHCTTERWVFAAQASEQRRSSRGKIAAHLQFGTTASEYPRNERGKTGMSSNNKTIINGNSDKDANRDPISGAPGAHPLAACRT